jgi:hypothetical protein
MMTIWNVSCSPTRAGSSLCLLSHEKALKQAKACHTKNSGRLSLGVIEPSALRKNGALLRREKPKYEEAFSSGPLRLLGDSHLLSPM